MPRPSRPAAVFALAATVLLAGACSRAENRDLSADPALSTPSAGVDGPQLPMAGPERSPDGLAANEAPLTGLPVGDTAALRRPALAVKIDNAPGARPQAGLVEADVVFEELVEGGLTRFLAVFHSEDPPIVGPVRSARSTDVPLLMPLVEPLFAWSGSNARFAEALQVASVVDVGFERRPDAYTRRPDRGAPSDLYTDPAMLRGYTPDRSLPPEVHFGFLDPGQPAGPQAEPVLGVEVQWGAVEVSFRWDPTARGWARSQNGTPHVDESGRQVAPANVVVQFVPYLDTGLVDVNGAPVPEAQIMSGAGQAWILSGGAVTEGSWTKVNATVPTVFEGPDGSPALFARGRTWVLLVPDGAATVVSDRGLVGRP